MSEGGYTAVLSIPRNIMHRGRWGGSPNPVGTYLYTTSAITVLVLKRHVIPSNEILVTPWVSHSLSFVRQPLSLSLSFLLFLRPPPTPSPFSSPPLTFLPPVLLHAPAPLVCVITLQLLILPLRLLLPQ